MSPKQKRDIAISVAEEDLPVARQIARALKEKNISYYLYTEHRAKNWGQHILRITLDCFGANAKYVLMITSKIFSEKYWVNIERQIAHVFQDGKEPYILQLRLDHTPIDGLSQHIVCEDWKDNAAEIAEIIKEKLRLRTDSTFIAGKTFRRSIKPTALSVAAIICMLILSNNLKYPGSTPSRDLQALRNNIISDTAIKRAVYQPNYPEQIDSKKLKATAPRCQGITLKKEQCKRTVRSGRYCWQHLKQALP